MTAISRQNGDGSRSALPMTLAALCFLRRAIGRAEARQAQADSFSEIANVRSSPPQGSISRNPVLWRLRRTAQRSWREMTTPRVVAYGGGRTAVMLSGLIHHPRSSPAASLVTMVGWLIDRVRNMRPDAWELRYGLAVVTVGLAWASREQFLPDAVDRSPFVVFGLAILLTSLLAGFGPGAVATTLSSIIAVLFYLPPYVALAVHAPFDLVLLALFVLEGIVAAIAGGAVRDAIRREDAIGKSTARFARFLDRAEALRAGARGDRLEMREELTPRELEVARLLALGLSNDQIAEAMFVSVNTIKTHLKRTYDKLGVQTRTEAVAMLIELDLLATPPDGDAARFIKSQTGVVEGAAPRSSRSGGDSHPVG